MNNLGYRFSVGPWNLSQGADPFGPGVRGSVPFNRALEHFKTIGFDAVQLHDDDAVPSLNDLSPSQVRAAAGQLRGELDAQGLVAEFVAPRLWEDPRTVDGGYTANDPACRAYALDRSRQAIDIANALGTKLIVLWLAREGTYIREAKDSRLATMRIVEAIDMMLDYDPDVRIAIEPKPNEPMDHTYIPTTGHALSLASLTRAPSRVGVLIESAHAILAGLDPSDEMGFASAHDKLWSVHLNDQNGLKFDQDKTFGSVDIRRAFNQVRVLETTHYRETGAFVGFDVKAMRTQRSDVATKHLSNSKAIFLDLVRKSRALDPQVVEELRQQRDYEELELRLVKHLLTA